MLADAFEKARSCLGHCFWKAQISALRACPPLCGAVSEASLGVYRSRGAWTKTLFHAVRGAPRIAARHYSNKRRGRIELARVGVVLTTRCTLRCDKCMAHIPDLKRREDIPTDDLLRDIRSLLARVDHIYDVFLTGGEAFLHPGLAQIMRLCAASGKVGRVAVLTNGTILPGAALLAALRETKTIVKIGNYPRALQPEAEGLKALLRDGGISFTHESSAYWRDMGPPGQPQAGSARRRFGVCPEQLCLPLLNGRLYLCGTPAISSEGGFLPLCEDDRIDLRASDPALFREQLRALLRRRELSACACCAGNTYQTPRVPVAAQREPGGRE